MTRKIQRSEIAVLSLGGAVLIGSMIGMGTAARQPAAGDPPAAPPSGALVELYDGADFKDSKCTVKTDVPDLGKIKSDDAKIDFGDKTASVKWNIPVGWQAVLCEDPDFKGGRHELKGTGRMESTGDLGCFNDKASSIRWEKTS